MVALVVLAACGSDNTAPPGAQPPRRRPAPPRRPPGRRPRQARRRAPPRPQPGVTAAGITPERCAANKAAGAITYLSSFDFSAAASILDVVVAKDRGYFDDMCLERRRSSPGFSTSNYPLVAGGQAQFSSAGSYTEILNYSKDGAKFVAVADYGKTPIEALARARTTRPSPRCRI